MSEEEAHLVYAAGLGPGDDIDGFLASIRQKRADKEQYGDDYCDCFGGRCTSGGPHDCWKFKMNPHFNRQIRFDVS